MKKIDIHVHAILKKGIERLSGGTFTTPEELRIMYNRLGIEMGVQLPCSSPEGQYHMLTNEDAIALVTQNPDLLSWFCNVDPRSGNNSPDTDLSHFLMYYKNLGAKGVGEVCANLYFDDPLMENLFYHCEKCNMPLIFHIGAQIGGCYGIADDLSLPRLEKALIKFPKLEFIGHSQTFWSEISSDVTSVSRVGYPTGKVTPGRVVELMRKYPNLSGDLSANSGYNALNRDPEFAYKFLDEFQDRLYFGTDICDPRNDMRLSFWLDDSLKAGKISEVAYKKICRENTLRLLNK